MIEMKEIRFLYAKKAVVLTRHFMERIEKRGIELEDIKSVVETGEPIEQYPDDYPHPSVLILGYTNNKPLHVVIGVGGGFSWLITAYYPDLEKWERDYKTRKAGL